MKICKTLLFIAALFLPVCVWAAVSPDDGFFSGSGLGPLRSFMPAVTDASVSYLRDIFGTVGPVLHGTTGQIIGKIFGIFNTGILVLAGAFLTTTTYRSILKTASDGSFMGEQKNMWMLGRVLVGTAALIPKFTGYSFIQVAVMWVVLHGIGLANHTWNIALEYLNTGGTVLSSPITVQDLNATLVGPTEGILSSQICTSRLQAKKKKTQYDAAKALQLNPQMRRDNPTLYQFYQSQVTQSTSVEPLFEVDKQMLYFPGAGEDKGKCGVYTWFVPGTTKTGQSLNALYRPYMEAGIRQLVADLSPLAKTMAPYEDLPTKPIPDPDNPDRYNDPQALKLLSAATDYLSILRPARVQEKGDQAKLSDALFEEGEREGWIMAGRFYNKLVSVRGQQVGSSSAYLLTQTKAPLYPLPPAQKTAMGWYLDDAKKMGKTIIEADVGTRGQSVDVEAIGRGAAASMGPDEDYEAIKDKFSKLYKSKKTEVIRGMGPVQKNVINMLTSVSSKWFRTFNPSQQGSSPVDPVAQLQSLGLTLLEAPIAFWKSTGNDALSSLSALATGFTFANIAYGAAVGVLHTRGKTAGAVMAGRISNPVSNLGNIMFNIFRIEIMWSLPFAVAIAVPLFVLGMSLGVYVPMIPFLMFLFASVGWFISVIEAMVAAPIIALGLARPERHEILGTSEQGLMLLLGVFFRPVCMIIGLIVGMILVFISLMLLNTGFFSIMLELVGLFGQLPDAVVGNYRDMATLIALGSMMYVYALAVMAVVNQSFSLIYKIGDYLLRWLGLQVDVSEVPQLMNKVESALTDMAQQAAKGGGDVSSGVGGARLSPGDLPSGIRTQLGKERK